MSLESSPVLAATHIFPEAHSCSVSTTAVLVLCEVQVGLHPQGQSVMRTSGMLQTWGAANSALPQAAFPSHSPLLPSPSPLLPSPLLISPSSSASLPPFFVLFPHPFPCALGSRKEGGFSKITIAFSSAPHLSFKLWESQTKQLTFRIKLG